MYNFVIKTNLAVALMNTQLTKYIIDFVKSAALYDCNSEGAIEPKLCLKRYEILTNQ